MSVATEVDIVIDPLLRELDRRADAVRVDAALDLPCLANEAPTQLPKDTNDRLLRFPLWLSRNKEVGEKETAENPRSTASVKYWRAAHLKDDPRCSSADLPVPKGPWNSHHPC